MPWIPLSPSLDPLFSSFITPQSRPHPEWLLPPLFISSPASISSVHLHIRINQDPRASNGHTCTKNSMHTPLAMTSKLIDSVGGASPASSEQTTNPQHPQAAYDSINNTIMTSYAARPTTRTTAPISPHLCIHTRSSPKFHSRRPHTHSILQQPAYYRRTSHATGASHLWPASLY